MNKPLVSIIIPTFNRQKLVLDTLLSIGNQVYTHWECIIVDDYSTDDSINVITKNINHDNRFRLISNHRKKGPQGARNCGILESKGELITFFDSDNLMLQSRLLKQVEFLIDNKECDICTCYSHLIDDNNKITGAFTWITEGNILKDILVGSTYVDFNSSMIRRGIIDKIGLLDEDCPSFQEWDTHIRLACMAKYGTVHELLVSYYQRSTGRISNNNKKELHGLTYIYSKHKHLWLEIAGKSIYMSKIFSLASRISREDNVFQKKMILLIPELRNAIFRFKLKLLISKIWNHL